MSRNKTLKLAEDEIDNLILDCIRLDIKTNKKEIINRVIHQNLFDCIDFIPNNIVDLLILDPPYNLTKLFGKTKFNKITDYSNLFYEWLENISPKLKDTATVYICADWQTSAIIYPILDEFFHIRNRITWEREKGRGAKANWKNCSEDIWFCTVSNKYIFNVEDVKLKRKVIAPYKESGIAKDWSEIDNTRLTYPSNLWTDITIPFWSMPENTNHPTQKSEKLLAKLILASSNKGDLVFDPFLGSGTTAVTARKLGRNFIGIEQEKEYCAYAIHRLHNMNDNIQGYDGINFLHRNMLK